MQPVHQPSIEHAGVCLDLGGEVLLAEVADHFHQFVGTHMVFEVRRIPDLLEELSELRS